MCLHVGAAANECQLMPWYDAESAQAGSGVGLTYGGAGMDCLGQSAFASALASVSQRGMLICSVGVRLQKQVHQKHGFAGESLQVSFVICGCSPGQSSTTHRVLNSRLPKPTIAEGLVRKNSATNLVNNVDGRRHSKIISGPVSSCTTCGARHHA